ncbi:MAG: EAL domain-containing protein [Venatoribacter sp.]
MTKATKSYSLRLLLPASGAVCAIFIFSVLLVLQAFSFRNEIEYFASHTALNELLQTKRSIESGSRLSLSANSDSIISNLALSPDINYAVLWSDTNTVLAATHFAWKGQQANWVVTDYSEYPINLWQSSNRETITIDLANKRILAYTPIKIGYDNGNLLSIRKGALLISYDLTLLLISYLQKLSTQALALGGSLFLVVLIFYYLITRIIFRPINALKRAMTEIGNGNFNAKANITGHGEFKELDNSLRQMAEELNKQSNNLVESKLRLRHLSDASPVAILFHEKGIILEANKAAEELLGLSKEQILSRTLYDLIPEHHKEFILSRIKDKNEEVEVLEVINSLGEVIPVEISARQHEYLGRHVRMVIAKDLRADFKAEATIRQLSMFDALTGLPNRRMLMEQIQDEVEAGELEPRRAALATINLNTFKSINDSMGMSAGDAVLKAVAKRLTSHLGNTQFFARVVSDTFALLQTELPRSLSEATEIMLNELEALLNCLKEPLEVHGQLLHISACAGVVMIPNDNKDAAELLREAETAMHQAKQSGLDRIHFFAHSLQEAASTKLALRNELQLALQQAPEQIQVFYQPQVDGQGEILGVEALVRWNSPKLGLVMPDSFISEAETSGLIVPLGKLVLEKAIHNLKAWQNDASQQNWAKTITLAINVSPRQFREKHFVSDIEQIIEQTQIDPSQIELELTESIIADDIEAIIEKMERIKALGVRFALDDFGTGFSSLSYLKRLPIDTLKIDRTFVMDIDADTTTYHGKRPAVLIEAIVSMAHKLGMTVLAEGVETPEQLQYLQDVGCDSYQGYYFSRPIPANELITWAQNQQKTPD